MSHHKFIFQSDELRYIRVDTTLKIWIKRYYYFIILALIFGVIAYFLTAAMGINPEEIRLKSINLELESNYHQLNKKLDRLDQQLLTLEQTDDNVYRALLKQTPVDVTIRDGGTGGSDQVVTGAQYSKIISSTSKRIDKIQSRLKIEENSLIKLLALAGNNRERMLHLPAIMPVSNKDLTRTGAGFGMRFHPILNISRMHEGIDFIAPTGTEVYATAKGVVKSSRVSRTFGQILEIDHGYGYITLYGHLDIMLVKVGQKVDRGDLIARVGSTGLSSGPHLHYEVHLRGKELDPVHYFFNDLNPEQYEEIIRLAKEHDSSLD